MDSIAAVLSSSSYGWATPPAASGPGHTERVGVASQYAEGFASDMAGFCLQEELAEKRNFSKSVLNNIQKSYRY